jgi:hypothetical protein
MFKTSPENAADIEVVSELLRATSIGATLSYAEISTAIGRNIQSHSHILRSAQARVEKETGSLYSVIRSVGIKRLASNELSSVGLEAIRKVRRTARRGFNRLDTVRTNDLAHEDVNKIIAHKSQLGAIALVADGRKSAKLAVEAEKSGNTIPAGRVLDMFKD